MTPSCRFPGAVAAATAASGRRASSTIGRAGPASRSASASSTLAEPPRGVQVGGHHRERLVLAVLAGAQRRDRRLAGRRPRPGGSRRGPSPRRSGPDGAARRRPQAPLRPAADIVDRWPHDDVASDPPSCGWPTRRLARRIEQRQPGAAVRAAGRLGVEAAVGGVVVLGGARARTSGSRPWSSAAGRRARPGRW